MSKLAQKIAKTTPILDTIPERPHPHGPSNQCFRRYGRGDLEDWIAIESLRAAPTAEGKTREWADVRTVVDAELGITGPPLAIDRFRRHWRRRCGCWPEDLRL